ncbi:hypothetical protein K458DRAFT_315553 [Lentithecium fluviatile CBS 122367]|uniref:Protein kinase domain-containing protein n=1 Tax=Lentithecium fluviatile CBS 122367 TaxID=1168545 RepID=A0A6G1IL34_9PLEO|nr:hypothetical protein K458DRAFT_315553 [Lentithecium fluviatile CBS 122367]
MAQFRPLNTLDLPNGCPEIPEQVSLDELIAIVTLHHPDAFVANRDTVYRKVQIKDQSAFASAEEVIGCHVYLHRVVGQATYSFGRAKKAPAATHTAELDVYLPNTSIAKKQFTIVPARETGTWRLEAASETITRADGVPLQKYTSRIKKKKVHDPHGLYLDESKVNRIVVLGMQIDIWFIRGASHVLNLERYFDAGPLHNKLQEVEERDDSWARSRWILGSHAEQCSTRSYRVLQRFNGRTDTAKLFSSPDGQQERDREILMLCKTKVHDSIVRYQASVDFEGIPAAITDTHQGMSPYGVLQVDLKEKHPGLRFQVAAAIFRPLFSALEFLHFHRIIHNSVSWESVLLRLVDDRVDKVLLVDYFKAHPVPPEEEMPRAPMIQDARQAMELVEDCCNIWALRRAMAPNTVDETEMRRRTETAEEEHAMARRTCAYYFDEKGEDRHSIFGKKLLKTLAKKEMEWSRAKTNQLHNAGQLQVGPLTEKRLQEIMYSWERSSQNIQSTKDYPMVLTLGHKFLDDLATPLYHKRWDYLPRDICSELRSLEGEVKDPWQTLTCTQKFPFRVGTFRERADAAPVVEFEGLSLAQYLAVCCDLYPDWREAIVFEYDNVVVPSGALITQRTIRSLRRALAQNNKLPSAMERTLRELEALADVGFDEDITVSEEHAIYYHVPSGMFNATQLHRLATMKHLKACLENPDVRCDNFAEVRGEHKLQGHYVPLSLLPGFANALGITVRDVPVSERSYPIVNPSDFSQVSHGRIVLVRTGLVAFASVPRTGNQFSHLPTSPLGIESADPFLPTYFGDMKVLPRLTSSTFNYPRSKHWAKFKTAEQIEEGAKVGSRKILRPKGRTGTLPADTHTRLRQLSLEPVQSSNRHQLSRLQKAIRERAVVIAEARAAAPRAVEEIPIQRGLSPQPKRVRKLGLPSNRENPGLTSSFRARNPNLIRSPPYRGLDVDQTFERTDRSPSLSKERRVERMMVKRWADDLTASDSEIELSEGMGVNSNIRAPNNTKTSFVQDRGGSPTEVASTFANPFIQQAMQPEMPQDGRFGAHWLAARGQAPQRTPGSSVVEQRSVAGALPVGGAANNVGTDIPDTAVMSTAGMRVEMEVEGRMSLVYASDPSEAGGRGRQRRRRTGRP